MPGGAIARSFRRPHRRELHLAEDVRRLLRFLRKSRVLGLLVVERGARSVLRGVQLAPALQHRREHFGPPAAARPDLHHGHVAAQTEERQRLLRVAIAVARAIALAALGAGQRRIERRGRGSIERLRETQGRQRQRCRKETRDEDVAS